MSTLYNLHRIIFIYLLLLLYFNNAYADCGLKIFVETQTDVNKYFCVDEKDSSFSIQEAIDYVYQKGGGTVFFDSKIYTLRNPVYLKAKVSLLGKQSLTKIKVEAPYAFTQKNEDIVEDITIKYFEFIKGQRDVNAVFNFTGGMRYCVFENLKFKGFEKSTIFLINPDFNGRPARNFVFNKFNDIMVDECNKCIVYSGNEYSPISNNIWHDIVLRKVYGKAIEAIKWADSEKWYNLYAQAWAEDVILIDLNVSDKKWEQIDRFHFYSPTLVYSPSLKTTTDNKKRTPVAIRFGKDTLKHFFFGVITDKKWDKFILDDGSRSYYILLDSVEEGMILKNPWMQKIQKGIKEKDLRVE